MQRRDAIVIGAGLNGLVAAAYLARAGLTVLVLERNERPGGIDAMREFAPGFHAPQFRLRPSALPWQVVTELGLTAFGLRQFYADAGVSLLENGQSIAHHSDRNVLRRELARLSARDADAHRRFAQKMREKALALLPYLRKPLPDISSFSLSNLRRQIKWASRVAGRPLTKLYEDVRFWSASCEDWLGDYFDTAEIRTHYASSVLAGATWAPGSAASAFHLLTPYLNDPDAGMEGDPRLSGVMAGPGGVAAALCRLIEAHGGEIRFEAEATDVMLKSGKASGVVLANGEELPADFVLSDLDAKHSFLSLFKWKDLPEGFAEQVAHVRMKGVTAKVNFALEHVPNFLSVENSCPALRGGVRIVGSMSAIDHAYDDWRSGVLPDAPPLFLDMPSLRDPSLAPPGKHVLSVLVQYVPLLPLDGAWDESRRAALVESVLNRIESYAPGMRGSVLAHEAWFAADMEAEAGSAFGDLASGEAVLDQMFFSRPMPGLGGKTPISNFYLCSAATHPGPLIAGQSGATAAQHLLLQKKRGGRRA